jgi:hypothetical protein
MHDRTVEDIEIVRKLDVGTSTEMEGAVFVLFHADPKPENPNGERCFFLTMQQAEKLWDSLDDILRSEAARESGVAPDAEKNASGVSSRKREGALRELTQEDIESVLGPGVPGNADDPAWLNELWQCSVCGAQVKSDVPVANPVPCKECSGIAFELVRRPVNT